MKYSIFFATLFYFLNTSFAFEISNLDYNCNGTDCEFLAQRIRKVLVDSSDERQLLSGIKFALDDDLISKFEFSYYINGADIIFNFDSRINTFLQDVKLQTKNDTKIFKSLKLQMKNLKIPFIGKIFNNNLGKSISEQASKIFIEAGFLDVKVTLYKKTIKNRMHLLLKIDEGKRYVIDDIKVLFDSKKIRGSDALLNGLYELKGAPWEVSSFNEKINSIVTKKRKKGFYDFSIFIKNKSVYENKVSLTLEVNEGLGHNFFISGTEKLSKIEILNFVKNKILQDRTRIDGFEIRSLIKNYLKSKGFFSSSIKLSQVEGYNKQRNKIVNHFIKIKEYGHSRVKKIRITGVSDLIIDDIKDLISKNLTNLHIKGYFVESEFVKYNQIISQYLASSGYFFSEVFGPFTKFSDDKSNVTIDFKIHLGTKVVVQDIDYGFSEKILKSDVLSKLKNRIKGVYFSKNVNSDKDIIINSLKENGYFYASTRKSNKKIEFFTDNYQKVILDYNIEPGKKIRVSKVKVIGLRKTRENIILRELSVKEGQYLTPSLIAQVNDDIVPLNLFSFVSVKPSKIFSKNGQYYSDIIVQVNERDYGLIRLSPGYRTDLGFKVESLFQRNNISGKNEAFSINLRGNKRTSLTYLDNRRQNEAKDKIEFSGITSYTIPYILGNKIRLQMNTEIVRRRFYGFDADIGRVGFRLTKNFNQAIGSSLKYQFENIKQYDATQASDFGYFRIGSISGSFFVDLRDRVVNPLSGSYHGISAEIGNPTLLSMDDENLEINFIKVVSRNRLYYTYQGLTFAASVSAGYQRNLADNLYYDGDGRSVRNDDGTFRTLGFLPSVKVFRLEGIDGVRGFSEEEINQLDDNRDILERRIQGEAFLLNTKFEVRRLLSDSIIGALFFDAGKLYVDSFKPLKLRKSAGVSFKFLTPVGTLDFDYGLKLDRKRLDASRQEMFGRFHLAIGFF